MTHPINNFNAFLFTPDLGPEQNYLIATYWEQGIKGFRQNLNAAFHYYQTSAEAGHPKAMAQVALWYELGKGVPENPVQAEEWYWRSWQGNDPDSLYNRGQCYLRGVGGLPQDIPRATDCFTRSANLGCPEAMFSLSKLCTDSAQVNVWLRKAAELGHSSSMMILAFRLASGMGCLQNLAEANQWYRKSYQGESGEPETAEHFYHLGLCFEQGNGEVNKNLALAIDCYQKSASRGCSLAKYQLAILKPEEMKLWLESAASDGHTASQTLLGQAFKSTNPPNHPRAADYFRRAANLGNGEAMYELAQCYLLGLGVPQDRRRAIDLFHKSAALGWSPAMHELGTTYFYSILYKDPQLGLHYYHEAVAKDYPPSFFELAQPYLNGMEGVEQNRELARKYLERGAALGDLRAQELLDLHFPSNP